MWRGSEWILDDPRAATSSGGRPFSSNCCHLRRQPARRPIANRRRPTQTSTGRGGSGRRVAEQSPHQRAALRAAGRPAVGAGRDQGAPKTGRGRRRGVGGDPPAGFVAAAVRATGTPALPAAPGDGPAQPSRSRLPSCLLEASEGLDVGVVGRRRGSVLNARTALQRRTRCTLPDRGDRRPSPKTPSVGTQRRRRPQQPAAMRSRNGDMPSGAARRLQGRVGGEHLAVGLALGLQSRREARRQGQDLGREIAASSPRRRRSRPWPPGCRPGICTVDSSESCLERAGVEGDADHGLSVRPRRSRQVRGDPAAATNTAQPRASASH